MNNRNSTESSTDFSNRSLVCDYVKGTLPGHLISEVEEKIASDRFFAAEVDYYEAIHQIIANIEEAFGDKSQERIDASIRNYYDIAGIDEQELIEFTDLVEMEYQYRELENEPLNYEALRETIQKIKTLNQHLIFLEDTIFEKYIHLIPDFINENVNPADRDALKRMAAGNAVFNQELEHQREIAYTVRRMEREALKLQLAKLRPQPIAAAKAARASAIDRDLSGHNIPDSAPIGSTGHGWRKHIAYTSMAAAIMIAIGSAALFYYFSSQESHQEIADQQEMSPAPVVSPTLKDTSADTASIDSYKAGTVSPDQLVFERKMDVNSFKFTEENFGFAGSSELTVKLFLLNKVASSSGQAGQASYYSSGRASYYVYASDTVSLFLNDTAAVKVYSISENDVVLADDEIEAGLYLYMNDNFYLLRNDSNKHTLQAIKNSQIKYLNQNR
jgi:hypothetical protein